MTSRAKPKKPPSKVAVQPTERSHADSFDAIVRLIDAARQRAYQTVNTALIDLYWQIGENISSRIAAAEWGDGVVERLAAHIARSHPRLRGFTRPNLFRMRQFYEAYAGSREQISALLRQVPWTHHLIIMGQSKRPEERQFYLRLVVEQRWGKRELERQVKLALFERAVLARPKVSPAVRQSRPEAVGAFKDAYMLDFLELPHPHTAADLHASLLAKLRQFLIELRRDFCFVGSEFPLQVGGRDFALDLLFFHRGLNCLVAIKLKVGRFEPEYRASSVSTSRRWTATRERRTRTRRSACCCVPARTTRWSSTRSAELPVRR